MRVPSLRKMRRVVQSKVKSVPLRGRQASLSSTGLCPGPCSRTGVLKCVEDQLEGLCDEALQMLVDKVYHHGGVAMTSDYSGIGQPEYVMRRIKQ